MAVVAFAVLVRTVHEGVVVLVVLVVKNEGEETAPIAESAVRNISATVFVVDAITAAASGITKAATTASSAVEEGTAGRLACCVQVNSCPWYMAIL